MRTTWTRFFVVGLCLLLCAGVLWGKKGPATTSIDRQDVLDNLNQDRNGGKLVAAAALRLVHAKQLLADGDTAGAVDVLNMIARMELPDTGPARTTMSGAFQLLAQVYQAHPAKSFALQQRAEDATRGVFTAPTGSQEDAGDDTCDAAVAVTLDHSEKMTVDVAGDHNWRSFSLSGPTAVRLQTLSDDTFGDDTDLNLYGGCSGGAPTDFIQFNDDGGDGFLSLIEVCLPAGEYFAEVGGFNNTATPDDFDFDITDLGPCFIPEADDFEPDNESSLANGIGFRNNGNGEGNQNGRENKNVQEHSIFPAGDIDFVTFGLSRANRVRLETFGDDNPDTIIGFSSSAGQLLATNDDKAPGEFSSRLDFCLPAGSDWLLAIIGFSASDSFSYSVAVDVQGPCEFEDEPNGVCGLANDMEVDVVYSGLQTAAGVAESDWWTFTLEEEAFITISTGGWDDFAVDTFLELWAGCPGNLIASDDDGGDGFLSQIGGLLPAGTYYVNATVSPFSVGSNYPYDIVLEVAEPPLTETEPNDSCSDAAANDAFFLGDDVLASISPVGDRDHYTLSLAGDSNVLIETSGPSGDMILQIESADGSTIIGCDDDSGVGLFSSWSCCLPAGDYCVVAVEFGDNSTIPNYNINFTDLGSCTADDPPVCDVLGFGCPF